MNSGSQNVFFGHASSVHELDQQTAELGGSLNPDIKQEDGVDSLVDFNTLGSVLDQPLTPNSIPPSEISAPALSQIKSEGSDSTEKPDRFVQEDLDLQSNYSGYLQGTSELLF